jgi:Icc protein
MNWLNNASQQRLRGAVFGHAHQEVAGRVGAWPVFGVPSTCFQFRPRSPKFAIDDKGPGYQWLDLAKDGTVNRTVRRVAV